MFQMKLNTTFTGLEICVVVYKNKMENISKSRYDIDPMLNSSDLICYTRICSYYKFPKFSFFEF